MVIVWGTTNAGKVEEVPGGMFHVITQFGHVYYIPLIPTGSYVVFEYTGDGGFRGASIPMSFKSMLAGWLRGGSIVAIIASVIAVPILISDARNGTAVAAVPVVIAVAAMTALFLSYKLKYFTEASYERAKELAQHVGLNETGLLMLEVTYGRLSAEQADAQLARLEEKAAAEAAAQAPIAAQVIE